MGSCYNKIMLDVPIQTVWKTVSDFHDMSWAPEVITKVTKVGDKRGDEVGAMRVLNEMFHETLMTLDAGAFTFSYRIDDGPGPVSKDSVESYIGVVKLTESESGTLVEWSSSFESENENEVADFCNPIYGALLSGLKKTLSTS
ncbi:SRPBCC family protein [uncultured Shewanella sp.]|uniref:SRPBCC family protein n=2 Tax=Shewanella TaxID=22 RepID=UPI002619363D|nr:SRPBCC family protein [uncultured Shewanella sp.]